jgi:hypothetical protein
VRVGANELVLRAASAAAPATVTQGFNPDDRMLSVGITRLRIDG